MPELPRGTVTFLFTDLQASTDLTRRLGERYAGVLADSRRLLREAVAEHDGIEVDTQGDGLFAAFERARDAVLAAASAQRSHAEHAWPGDDAVRLRMGLHTAEPHVWDEGYAGVGLTRAARICAAGHGGQVLLSRSTAGIVADEPFEGLGLRDLGLHRLKGLVWREQIFQLVIEGLPADFPPLDTLEGAGPTTETMTMLLTDIEGLTKLVDALSPEEFRALVAEYHQLAQAVVQEFEGVGGIGFGDASFAVFRSPAAAVRTAAELQRRVAAHRWPAAVPLRVGIALDSGEVVATAYGHFGHAVSRCARMADMARGGQTLVSDVTRGLLGERLPPGLDLVELGERELRGAAIRVYEIVEGAPKD
ncbi:MAG TPA: adenylate/guanylate cyclase domain-containing protein [Gaiellaceae bacterium]|nr:adenylate/guanylate cyclase domain-containing protein [Gaiellaceae bacterium]